MTDRTSARQLPLALAHRPGLTRDDLVVTPANARAVAMVDRWPDWPSSVVLLAGPPGAGKSHLASIWGRRAGARSVSAQMIEPYAEEAAAGRAVLVDGADVEGLDERGLFHLVNALKAEGGHLLLTARRFPAAWGVALPDLLSRLKAATLVEIEEPDDMLLAGVVTKLFADRQVEVEPHVVQFLVRRIERSLSSAIDVVERLDEMALERKTRITRALAAEALGGTDIGQGDFGF